MQKKPNTKKIGLFIITGFAAIVLMILASVGGKLLSNKQEIIMHFDESISGLSVGSPVVFSGVQVGKVKEISLLTSPEDLKFSISVYAEVQMHKNMDFKSQFYKEEYIKELIERGLRARLASQSILTGQLMIELVILPDTKPVFRNNDLDDDDVPEIPTVLSAMGSLSQGLHEFNLKETAEKINKILTSLNDEIIPETKTAIAGINEIVSDNKDSLNDSLNNLNDTMSSFKQGAKTFRNLTDYLERHPEALLTGKQSD